MANLKDNALLSLVLSKRNLKAAVKDLTFDEISKAIDILNAEAVKIKEAEAEEQMRLENRKETLKQIRDLLVENDLSPADLLALDNGVKKAVAPPKYCYKVNGKEITWSGAGRMPKVIKAAIEAGAKLEDMAI